MRLVESALTISIGSSSSCDSMYQAFWPHGPVSSSWSPRRAPRTPRPGRAFGSHGCVVRLSGRALESTSSRVTCMFVGFASVRPARSAPALLPSRA